MFCYKDGEFTDPSQTVDGMVRSSIDFMTANLGFSVEQATQNVERRNSQAKTLALMLALE